MPARTKKKQPLTLGDLFKKISAIKATQLVYVALLLAVFAIGYLVSRVQMLEKGGNAQTTGAAPTGSQQAAAPAAPDPKTVLQKLTDGHFPAKGNKDAKVTLVEFADFRCPYCESFFTSTEPQLIKDYVDSGKVKFEFRNYQFLGDPSVFAGNAAECANEQGKFWEFHDWLYQNQPSESDTSMYNVDKMTEAAGTLGLNTDQFRSCLSAKKYADNVQKDMTEGQSVGVSGTPTFYINGRQIVGAEPYDNFKTIIEDELKK